MSYINQIQGLVAPGSPTSGENPLLIAGSNASNVKVLNADSSGNLQVVGTGTAGSPGTAALTIQGISGGQAVPVSGTFFQTTQPVSIASTVNVAITSPLSVAPAARNSSAIITTPTPQVLFRTTFASVQAGVDSTFFTTIVTGSGQSVNQSAGNLVLTSGTTINAETILRSTSSFSGAMIARIQNILSQRIVNNNFFVELVDVIGDNLTASASSATVLVVTIPSNPFTSANVGQSMYIGNLAGGLTGVPNRYAIASVAGNNVTFTVAGFSVTSGTCSLFGWNYYQQQFQGATATQVAYDAQRRGWNSGQTTATINTTASPGTMTIMQNEDGNAYFSDQLVASGTAVAIAQRASRVINLPEESTMLYLQIRMLNGSTAPASTTTWTIGMASVENYAPVQTSINTIKPQGLANTMPVSVTNSPAVTITSGTVTSVTAVAALNSVATTNGLSIGTVVTAATPATTSIKATAGRLHHISVGNPNAAAVYLKIFNVAAPTLGTTAANMNYLIPATSQTTIFINPVGLFFSTAIVIAVTGGISLTDNTSITSGCAVSYSWI